VPDSSSESLSALACVVPGEDSFELTLQQVVDLAPEGIGGCAMAGITLLDRTGPSTAAASSDVAARVDALQYGVNSGPCLEAYRHQLVSRIDSTDTDEQWPEFSRNAAAAGIHSVLAYPLVVRGDGIGALNLYSVVEFGFDEHSERAAGIFAVHASVTLANARAFWITEELRRNLLRALDSRGVIDQAKGILMSREGITADEAFEILRRASQRANRKVHDLAQDVVEGAARPRRSPVT
jgi:GAF domain-containing protein